MLEIKDSSIHGKGVFSTVDIKAGEKIFDYIGVEMSSLLIVSMVVESSVLLN